MMQYKIKEAQHSSSTHYSMLKKTLLTLATHPATAESLQPIKLPGQIESVPNS